MNHYELLYLVPATYSDEELEPIKQKVKGLIAKFEGKVTHQDTLGKKKLAYPIDNVRHGYYLIYEFDLEPDKQTALERELKLTPEVLRHQIASKQIKTPNIVQITEEKVKKEQEQEIKQEQKKNDKDKVKLEDLDQKLDEILEGEIL